jgi:fatty acid desaturase
MTDETLVRFTAHQLPREDLHALMARSDGPALLRAVWHFGVLVITGTALWRLRSTGWLLPLLVVHGYVLAFVFCALHETAHRTAFRTRWLNAVVGALAGLLTFWPYRNYRVYHWEHHRYTQDPARDPELYFAKPASRPAYLLVLTGIPNAIRRLGDMLRLAAGRADRPWMASAERRPLIVEARAYLGVYAAAVLGSVWCWPALRSRCSCGSLRGSLVRRSCGRISWPSTRGAHSRVTASRTRAPRSR